MTSLVRPFHARPTILVLALLAAYGPSVAEVVTEASVEAGLYGISGSSADRAQFGQYNGLRNVGNAAGILGFDYYRRDVEAGTSILFTGANLALQTRELGFAWKNQGDWKFSAGYNEQLHYDPYSANTGLLGFGTSTPQVLPLPGGVGTGSDVDFKVKRSAFGLGFWKAITPTLSLDVNLKTEDRDGSRLFGNGFTCASSVAPGCKGATLSNTGSAVLMLPEPINSNQTQVEARVNYVGQKFNLSAGYYGSFYKNSVSVLAQGVPDSLYNPVGSLLPLNSGLQSILNNPLALPPDNQAQFFDVTGNYAFTPTTQGKFKLSYSQATQDQSFAGAGLTGAPAGSSSLGGKVSTTLAVLGVTSRPMPKLSLLADLRYEDKNDQTPIAPYNVEGAGAMQLTFTNMHLPLTTTRARGEAAYQFTNEYRGTLDLSYESINRGVFTASSAVSGVSALRQSTDETGVRAELRRTLSENLSGAISLASSWRNGSDWLKPNSGTGVSTVTDPNAAFTPASVYMPNLADRQRDKLKLTANWQPTEGLSLQFLAEGGRDNFSSPTQYPLQGVESAGMNLFGIDWDYVVSEKWSINGYLSQGTQTIQQSRYAGYVMSFKDTNTGAGVGFSGKPMDKLQVGGNLAYVNDKNVYPQGLEANAPAESVALLGATGGLPDVVFRQTTLSLFGKYELDKQSAVRVSLLYQRSYVNDWAWGYNGTPFAYSDATTLYQQANQSVGMLGVSYIYKF